jgi:hypothetical protein
VQLVLKVIKGLREEELLALRELLEQQDLKVLRVQLELELLDLQVQLVQLEP